LELKTIARQDFLDYINENWTKETDKMFIDMYTNSFYLIGKNIGLYDNNKLIGFIFYKEDIRKPVWVRKTQEHKPSIISRKYKNFWEYNLLEIHSDYRFNGLGSMLLQEVYNMMPENYVLIGMSEHTDNHIRFYKKNGFIQNTYYKHPQNYLFYRIKEIRCA
jgi:ribosomal protein S18 acetylase RimI-like enzyme